MTVVEELRGGIRILGAPFSGSESLVGKLRGRHFSGLEGAWLCLTNSGAALASWGAVFTCLGAQRAAFLGLGGTRLWLRNSRAIFASWGAVFRFRVLGWEAQRAEFFRFRGRLIVVAEFRGGLCILGSSFSRAEDAWMERQGSESGISSRPQGALSAELKGQHFL